MIRFVLKMSERNAIAGYDREALVTVDADVPSLEALLKRGGHGENGFEIWQLLGAEVIDAALSASAEGKA